MEPGIAAREGIVENFYDLSDPPALEKGQERVFSMVKQVTLLIHHSYLILDIHDMRLLN